MPIIENLIIECNLCSPLLPFFWEKLGKDGRFYDIQFSTNLWKIKIYNYSNTSPKTHNVKYNTIHALPSVHRLQMDKRATLWHSRRYLKKLKSFISFVGKVKKLNPVCGSAPFPQTKNLKMGTMGGLLVAYSKTTLWKKVQLCIRKHGTY